MINTFLTVLRCIWFGGTPKSQHMQLTAMLSGKLRKAGGAFCSSQARLLDGGRRPEGNLTSDLTKLRSYMCR